MPQVIPVDHDPFDPHGDTVRRLQALEARLAESEQRITMVLGQAIAQHQDLGAQAAQGGDALRQEMRQELAALRQEIAQVRALEHQERQQHLSGTAEMHQMVNGVLDGLRAELGQVRNATDGLRSTSGKSTQDFAGAMQAVHALTQRLDRMASEHDQLKTAFERLTTTLQAPKRIVRDKDDRPIGVVVDHRLGA